MCAGFYNERQRNSILSIVTANYNNAKTITIIFYVKLEKEQMMDKI